MKVIFPFWCLPESCARFSYHYLQISWHRCSLWQFILKKGHSERANTSGKKIILPWSEDSSLRSYSQKSDKSCKFNTALLCCEGNRTARCATVIRPSYQLVSKFSSLLVFGRFLCVFKFISAFLICAISISNGFSFCISAFRNKAWKLYCYFPLYFMWNFAFKWILGSHMHVRQ